MGLNFEGLAFFDACHAVISLQSPFLSLGSQDIRETHEAIDAFCAKEKYPRFAAEKNLSSLFAERYQIAEYADLDLNDKASIKADLTKPIPDALRGKWRTIYDGGTFEHVFDIAAAFKGTHDLCCTGGIILHIAPLTWLSHGYYNLTPYLFESIARANQYRILAVGYCFRNSAPFVSKGVLWMRPQSPALQGLVLTEIGGKKTSRHDHVERLRAGPSFPIDTLFCIGYQKQADTSFMRPYDIQA